MRTYKSSEFTWNPDGSGYIEASDMQLPVGGRNPSSFAVVSDQTGLDREFYRQQIVQRDAQRYVTFDSLPQISITVFND